MQPNGRWIYPWGSLEMDEKQFKNKYIILFEKNLQVIGNFKWRQF